MKKGKIWVIADIHGCYKTLFQLIEHKIQPQKQDFIYFLGDYIDRGKQSKEVIDYIIHLQNKGYQVQALKGNHEDVFTNCYHAKITHKMTLEMQELYAGWIKYGGKATLQSFEQTNLENVPYEYIQFLEKLPYYAILDKFVLVHAGLNFYKSNPFEDKEAMLWAKNFYYTPEKVNFKQVVHGHTPRTLNQIRTCIEAKEQVIPLDNGCVYEDRYGMGNLLALELNTMKLEIQRNIDFKVVHNFSYISI